MDNKMETFISLTMETTISLTIRAISGVTLAVPYWGSDILCSDV